MVLFEKSRYFFCLRAFGTQVNVRYNDRFEVSFHAIGFG